MATYSQKVTTTGSAGSATGTATIDVGQAGYVDGIVIDYDPTAPASTTVTIAETEGLAQTLLNALAGNTDTELHPVREVHDNTGTGLGFYGMFYVDGPIQISVTNSNELDPCITVTIRVIERDEL